MAILFQTQIGDVPAWTSVLQDLLPDDEFRIWPNVGDPADIEFAIMWTVPVEELAKLPALRAILLLGSGGNHLRPVEGLPDVPIVRLVDPEVAADMAAWAMHWVMHFHRNLNRYLHQESTRDWTRHHYPMTSEYTVGVLGLGNIGGRVAAAASALGYPVLGWSRSGRPLDGVNVFGADGLGEFLSQTNALVNVLPLTPDTRRLLDADRLAMLPAGSAIINMGRGGTIDDDALISAIDSGHLEGAALDVFRGEPLGPESRFWEHPSIRVTPHISGTTYPRSAARFIAANIDRIRAGQDAFPLFDPVRGY